MEIHELLDRLEILYPTDSFYTDLRKLVLNDDKYALFRLVQKFTDSQLVEGLRKYKDDESFNKDCFSRGQLESKLWVLRELEKITNNLGTVFLCAGWYGTLATMLFESSKIHLDKIRSFDIDENCWRIAETFNKPWVMDDWKFKAITQDIHNINFVEHTYKTLRSNGTERELFDKPNTIINTSCEHIKNWNKWWAGIPKGKMCVLQSNDYKELPEHINCVDDIEHFKSIAPMTTYLYEGDLILGKYTRYMLIGIK